MTERLRAIPRRCRAAPWLVGAKGPGESTARVVCRTWSERHARRVALRWARRGRGWTAFVEEVQQD